jgi:HAMP domain-containing protein
VPLIAWFSAFLIWFYWYDLTGAPQKTTDLSRPVAKANPSDSPPAKAPKERILEEDRKKLEDILKRRGG